MTPKYIITLRHLTSRLDEGINQLEALSLYGETCLHSTISGLANKHGYEFIRRDEPHIHQHGGKTYFRRYWLKTELIDKAQKHIRSHEKAPTATNDTGLSNQCKGHDHHEE